MHLPPPTPWKQFFALIPRRTLSKNLVWGLCAQRTRYVRRAGGDTVIPYIGKVNEYATLSEAASYRLMRE